MFLHQLLEIYIFTYRFVWTRALSMFTTTEIPTCANLFFLKRRDTPWKFQKKIELRNDINSNHFVFKKYSNDIKRIRFLNIFQKYFMENMRWGAKWQFWGGGKPSRLIPPRLIFFVICSSQNPAFVNTIQSHSESFIDIQSHLESFRVIQSDLETLRVIVIQSDSKWFKVIQSYSETFRDIRVILSVSECFRVIQSDPIPLRVYAEFPYAPILHCTYAWAFSVHVYRRLYVYVNVQIYWICRRTHTPLRLDIECILIERNPPGGGVLDLLCSLIKSRV